MGPVRVSLPSVPDAIPAARAAMDELRGDLGETAFKDLVLLVSEVVTNAVRHADGRGPQEIGLSATVLEHVVRVEVHDGGAGFDAPLEPGPRTDRASGWGLFLVARLSTAWGTERAPDAFVWFELPR